MIEDRVLDGFQFGLGLMGAAALVLGAMILLFGLVYGLIYMLDRWAR